MSNYDEIERERDRLQQKEQHKNPMGNLSDSINNAQSGVPNTSGMSWKELAGAILFIIVIFIGYSFYKFLV